MIAKLKNTGAELIYVTTTPGDVIYLREGRYRVPIQLNGLRGTAEKPITSCAGPGERVVLDGTVPVTGSWMTWPQHIEAHRPVVV